jgi:hypothetical protein
MSSPRKAGSKELRCLRSLLSFDLEAYPTWFLSSDTSRRDTPPQISSILSPFSGNSPRGALDIALCFTSRAFHLRLTRWTHNIMRSCFAWQTSQHSPILISQKGISYQPNSSQLSYPHLMQSFPDKTDKTLWTFSSLLLSSVMELTPYCDGKI